MILMQSKEFWKKTPKFNKNRVNQGDKIKITKTNGATAVYQYSSPFNSQLTVEPVTIMEKINHFRCLAMSGNKNMKYSRQYHMDGLMLWNIVMHKLQKDIYAEDVWAENSEENTRNLDSNYNIIQCKQCKICNHGKIRSSQQTYVR